MSFSFKEFKKYFYSSFSDFKIFNGLEFNYLKVALDGLKVNYVDKGEFPTPIFKSNLTFNIFFNIYKVKNFLNGNHKRFSAHLKIAHRFKNSKYMIIDPGRSVKNFDGELVPLYFHKIYESLKNNNSIFFISENEVEGYDNFDDVYNNLTMMDSINHSFSYELRKELKKVYFNIKDNSSFNDSDLDNIKCAFQKFYNDVIFWLNILEILKPKEIFFICHYHKEGLIYSAKKLGIKIIEYQHGLIAKSDIFYNFPTGLNKIKNDCLFPDEMRVFGKYWKNILLNGNFLSSQTIKVDNYTLFERKEFSKIENEEISSFINNKKIILVTTQIYLSHRFINYIDNLVTILDDEYCIIIKPHPSEDIGAYSKYLSFETILVTNISSDLLLSIADFHITMYSTTAFDALRYNLSTFYIYTKNQIDYIKEVNNAIGGVIIYDFKTKIWNVSNNVCVKSIDFFHKNHSLTT